ncbi:MAG: DUF6768 family protein [Pseudomonadota bacterium]|nr:DUF6768 family protein [Pseudomonadota bacterium]
MTRSNKDLDALIAEALDADDRELLAEVGDEPGYFSQARGLFRGRLAWVMWLAYVMNIIGGMVAVWAAWQMFQTTDPVMTVRWAVLILVSFGIVLFMKNGLGLQMMTNRTLREIKRLELQIARSRLADNAPLPHSDIHE